MRRLWLVGLWLLLPWPMPILGDAFVPGARYALLSLAASAIAITEGAAGPVLPLVGLFTGMAIATALGCWLLAWGIARALAPLPSRLRWRVTWLCLLSALALAVTFDPYRTSFGRAPVGNLLDLLS